MADYEILVDALPRESVTELERLVRTRTDLDLRTGRVHTIKAKGDFVSFCVGDQTVVVRRRGDKCVL